MPSKPTPSIFHVGDRVTQPMLGDGTVTRVDEVFITVDFDKRGIRTIRTEMAVLSRVDARDGDR